MARKVILILTLAALALPAAASAAETFCVHSPANCVGTPKANLQAALDAANSNGANTKDTIRVGVGLFYDGPAVDVAGNKVDIIGTAANQTAFTSGSNSGGLVILDIQEPASTLSHLRVHHNSAAPSATGIKLAGHADHVMVSNQGFISQFDGIQLVGTSASLDNTSVSLVHPPNIQNRAVFVGSGVIADIEDSHLEGTVGVTAVGDVEVIRTRIHATQGVVASSGSDTKVRDTEIRVPGPFDSNFQKAALAAAGNGPTTLEADRVTAYGNGAGSYGLWVAPNAGATNDSKIDIQGSVLDGFSTDIRASQGGGSTATVVATRNAYDLSSTSLSGGPSYTQSQTLNLNGVDPKFRNPANGDLRLRHDSPLVEAGDPTFNPFLGGLDALLKTRVVDGDGDTDAVVDLGAHEYQRKAPVADAFATPQVVDPGQAVTFHGEQSFDADGELLTHEWSWDDGTMATGETVQHAFATPGQHTATLKVTDPVGLTDTVTVTVNVQAAPASPGGQTSGTGTGPAPSELTLRALRLTPTRFRARQLRRRARGAARRPAPVGTTIRFALSDAARVTFAVDRALRGRRVGKSCRKPTRANRTRKPCTRWVKVGGFARPGQAGANALRFDGRLAGRALPAGRHRLRARAQDGQGRRSAPGGPKSFSLVR
jgi:PKD domain